MFHPFLSRIPPPNLPHNWGGAIVKPSTNLTDRSLLAVTVRQPFFIHPPLRPPTGTKPIAFLCPHPPLWCRFGVGGLHKTRDV